MPDDTAQRRLALLQWFHNPDRTAAWAAMHRAGMVSAREPERDEELPLLRAAE